MDSLRLYKIDIDYIKYLYSFDNRVQFNTDKSDEYSAKRPYLGIVLRIDQYNYFVPLEHPRLSHRKMKNNIFIYKIHNGNYGILGFNNMIPVKKEELIEFDINKEKPSYRHILISQYHYCNKNVEEIRRRAEETYERSQKNSFLRSVCCNFKLLEEKCLFYSKYKK